MRCLLFIRRTMANFDAGKLGGQRLVHAQLDSGLPGGLVGRNHFALRRSPIHERHGATAKRGFEARYGLYLEIGNMNRSKCHKYSVANQKLAAAMLPAQS